MTCSSCRKEPASAGVLCSLCAAELCGPTALCPEQVVAGYIEDACGSLVDQWGRTHPLGPTTVIGRQPGDGGIVVAEPSVSRRHAEIRRTSDGWQLVDLESSNGTFRNGNRIVSVAAISTGDMVTFGHVSFFFNAQTSLSAAPTSEPLPTPPPVKLYLADADEDRDETFAGLRTVPVTLAAPSGGGGGLLEVNGVGVQLTHVQFELVRLLVDRMLAEPDRDERVRGFVRSSELGASLPWDTARPDDNNLKQLVRRLRRTLERAGIADIVESRHGFGYRLRVVPARRPHPR